MDFGKRWEAEAIEHGYKTDPLRFQAQQLREQEVPAARALIAMPSRL